MNQGTSPTRVLFVCVENAGRSQMAEAFARRKWLQAASALRISHNAVGG